VESLKETDLAPMIKNKKHAFLLFYAPWCSTCEEFSLPFVAAAADPGSMSQALFGAIDCGDEKTPSEFCLEQNVDKIPSVRYYKHGDFQHDVTNIDSDKGYKDFLANPKLYVKNKLPKLDDSPLSVVCKLSQGNCGVISKIEELKRDRAKLEQARDRLQKAQSELAARAAAAEVDRQRLLETERMLEAQIQSALSPSQELALLLDRAKKAVKDRPTEAIDLLRDTADRFAHAYGEAHEETKATHETVQELIKLTQLYQESLAEAGAANVSLGDIPVIPTAASCFDKKPRETMILMNGQPASCEKLASHCDHPESGAFVRKACPLSCGACGEGDAEAAKRSRFNTQGISPLTGTVPQLQLQGSTRFSPGRSRRGAHRRRSRGLYTSVIKRPRPPDGRVGSESKCGTVHPCMPIEHDAYPETMSTVPREEASSPREPQEEPAADGQAASKAKAKDKANPAKAKDKAKPAKAKAKTKAKGKSKAKAKAKT